MRISSLFFILFRVKLIFSRKGCFFLSPYGLDVRWIKGLLLAGILRNIGINY